jgi:hypothetical protein
MPILGTVDWDVFYPAIRIFLSGGNPYLYGNGLLRVFEPFWTYLLLSPLALLPPLTSRIVLTVTAFLVYAFSAVKMGAKPWQLGLFMLSAPVINDIYNGNITWLVTMGLWMPPQIGLFFVLMKPQIGFLISIYWFYTAWKTGGPMQVIKTFGPVVIAYLISFALYGFWFRQMLIQTDESLQEGPILFPYLVPSAIILFYFAIRRNEMKLSALATQFVAPYVSMANFASSMLCLFDRPVLFVGLWLAWWIPVFVSYGLSR